ncbi:hypothetical protein K493DRAFT_351233 [Basidiobolus meristosporus CBS 931.73]|uniref:Carbohydrate-binding module family 19 domain-containing protein n=1 Tax=Basidiobolus meristosporus CBS 931.73 TaxID=1314790 RepID=A0A1Y1YCX4_9FUNG|nr:hypothetical protein K493DRAFT_351233 [Basidiobolus meristosporus CBS 931.73]|eukprot:ORX95842.1 hypothetical protein K493DRAFT_351233 [Basidiobolus meristosporus CBS 931.73]
MKFQSSTTLFGLLALFAVQAIAQDSSAVESVALPTVTDVASAEPSSAPSADLGAPSDKPSSVAPTSSIASPTATGTPIPGPNESTVVPNPSGSRSSVAPIPTEGTGECQDGYYQCTGDSSPEFQWCVFGKWTQNSCAQGTICKPTEGNGIACDWPSSGNSSE